MYSILRITFLFLFLCAADQAFAQNDPRSDSTDILNYDISLDLGEEGIKKIKGHTGILLKAKKNISSLRFDLLKLPVAAVTARSQPLSYSYNDTLLRINLASALTAGDTITIFISYEGIPYSESFGGFYFVGLYSYNLGVAFQADPHSIGRAWFPCYDNFIEKSSYAFHISCDSTKNALCNGEFKGFTNHGSLLTWHWQLDEQIPSYLASVAVAPYTWVSYFLQGMNQTQTVILASLPADTGRMKVAFARLPAALQAFESHYGPHPFSRIGFNIVPFNGGAMEHATNISYPLFALDNPDAYETLWAHEFSHHWWGDNITCASDSDMWLNEGWASYSEKIFLENAYGKSRYKSEVSANHKYVLQFAHINDLQPRAISGVPHEYVYGTHVYKKGADVAHTLRAYMGDDDFFEGIAALMSQKKYQNISSIQFRDFLQAYTSADLTAFFDNWVFEKGFPHVSIYSKDISKSGNQFKSKLRLRQVSRFSNQVYRKLPLEIALYDRDLKRQLFQVVLNSADTTVELLSTFEPLLFVLDPDEKISDAITDKSLIVSDTGSLNFGDALMSMHINQKPSDSILVRVEHHWIGADGGQNFIPGLRLSDYRHWTIDGTWNGILNASASISYNGNKSSDAYLDHTLIRITEDSLVLMYRPHAQAAWTIYPDYIKNMAVKTDKRGSITINNIRKGEYALAMYDKALGKEEKDERKGFRVQPNPANDKVTAILPALTGPAELQVFDASGRQLKQMNLNLKPGMIEIGLDTSGLSNGLYLLSVVSDRGEILGTEKLLIRK